MPQAFTYDGTTYSISLNPIGPKGFGFWAHVPTCTTIIASFPSWCYIGKCVVSSTIPYAITCNVQPKTLHATAYWEYNAKISLGYKRKWGTNLVWKWWHVVHALDFVATFVNFEKDTTMVTTTCHALYPNPNDAHQELFSKVAKGYWDTVQE